MIRRATKYTIATLTVALTFSITSAQAFTRVETWDDGNPDLSDWARSSTDASLSNPGTQLSMTFGQQGGPGGPGSCIATADSLSSSGNFVGDYIAAGVTTLSFDFEPVSHAPS